MNSKEMYAGKTSTLVRRAPLSMKSSEPRVSGQYASSDDGLSTDSELVESSHSNTQMDWSTNVGEAMASEVSPSSDNHCKPLQGSVADRQEAHNEISHIDREPGYSADDLKSWQDSNDSFSSETQNEGDVVTEEEDLRNRRVSLVRKRSKADQLKELRRLPSINEKRVIIQRKIEGHDIDENESDDDIENESSILPKDNTTESVPVNLSSNLQKRNLKQMPSRSPPPIPERTTKPKIAILQSIHSHSDTEMTSNQTESEIQYSSQDLTKEDTDGIAEPVKNEIASGAPVILSKIDLESNNERDVAGDEGEDRPPSPPLSTHPEVIAARLSKVSLLDNVVTVTANDTSVPNSSEINKQEDIIVNITTEESSTLSSGEQMKQEKALTLPRSPVPRPRSKPKPRPRSIQSSLVIDDDSASQISQPCSSNQLEVRNSEPTLLQPNPMLAQDSSDMLLQISPTSPNEEQNSSSPSPTARTKETPKLVVKSASLKDETPSPSMMRRFYFFNKKVAAVPEEVFDIEDGAPKELSLSPTPETSEPLEVSSPTHVHKIISCGPMNSRRNVPPVKKRRSIFRKK